MSKHHKAKVLMKYQQRWCHLNRPRGPETVEIVRRTWWERWEPLFVWIFIGVICWVWVRYFVWPALTLLYKIFFK